MSKIEIVTTTLETGETVLAKRERVEDSFDGTAQFQELPLRYDNETQALAKIASIRPALVEIGHRAKVIKQGGRFLVFVFDAEPGIREEPTYEQVQAALRTPDEIDYDFAVGLSYEHPGELTLIGQQTGRELPISEAIALSGVESLSDLGGAKVRVKLPTSKLHTEEPGMQTISVEAVEQMMLSREREKTMKFMERYESSTLPGFQKVFTKIVHKDLDAQFKPKRPFATTTGKRMNPRSRHNHPTNTTDDRYYYVS